MDTHTHTHLPVKSANGWCMTPMTGLPSTATHTIVVTNFTRFSVGSKMRDAEESS